MSNTNYYDEIFSINPPGSYYVKWSWPAFFFGTGWLAYRKKYLLATCLFLLILSIELGTQIYAHFHGYTAQGIVSLLSHIFLGLYGISIYGKSYGIKKQPDKNTSALGFCLWGILALVISFVASTSASTTMLYLDIKKKELIINGDDTFNILGFSKIEAALKNLESGKNQFVIVTDHKGDSIQTLVDYPDNENQNVKYYHVEYSENGKFFWATYMLTEKEALQVFYKFHQNDNSFKIDRTWEPLHPEKYKST